jgi:predicted nucleic acid-binding protein
MARGVPHLIGPFLDQLAASKAVHSINPDAELLDETKRFLRRHADQGYSFVDCLSFRVMNSLRVLSALAGSAPFIGATQEPD